MRRIEALSPLQLKMFYIYLSKINPKDEDKNTLVTMPISEYQYILNNSNIKRKQIIEEGKEIIDMKITIPLVNSKNEINGFSILPIFTEFKLFQNELDQQWYVSAECSPKIAPFLFDLKQYSSYQLWNIVGLTSVAEIRLYDILNQYLYAKTKTFQLNELREQLGLKGDTIDQYPRWSNFKTRILDKAKENIAKNTDIRFDYEPIKAEKNKVIAVKFTIYRNPQTPANCRNTLTQLGYNEETGYDILNPEILQDIKVLDEMRKICNFEFNGKQIQEIYLLLKKLYGIEDTLIPIGETFEEVVHFSYKKYSPVNSFLASFNNEYLYMCDANPDKRYAYIKKVLKNKIAEQKNV